MGSSLFWGAERLMGDPVATDVYPFEIVDPLKDANWNRVPAQFSEATVFHAQEWARVIRDTYSYTPYYLSGVIDGGQKIFCLFEVSSWLTGRRAISLPFSDECPMLGVKSEAEFKQVLENAGEFGRAKGWKTIEVRGTPRDYLGNHSASFYTHQLDLTCGVKSLYERFDSGVRRAVRKAEKEGVRTEVRTDFNGIEEYFHLHCLTRRKHGVPPQPLRFFQNIQRHLMGCGMGFTVLARLNGQVLAGAVFLHFRGQGLYKFGASDPTADHFRPSNLAMWKGIQHLSERGVENLNLGRTSIGQEGLRRYKLGWGTREKTINYVKLNLANRSYEIDTGSARSNRLLGKLPLPVLKRIGALLYPHLG